MKRDNEFFDRLDGGAASSPIGTTLGWELISVKPDEGTIEIAYTADDRFLNPFGLVQGGILGSMLDDTLGSVMISVLERGQIAPTTDLHIQFLRPAKPGRFTGRGRVVRQGKSIAFLSGELSDADNRVVAVATATATITGLSACSAYASRTGSSTRPCMSPTCRQRSASGSAASSISGKRGSSTPRATSASIRARDAPRQ